MRRTVPTPLYEEVSALAEAIAQPEAGAFGAVDGTAASSAYADLLALYERLEASGRPDPFVTETLADFTDDSAVAISLYRRALEQSGLFPGELLHTKRIGLARQLIAVGQKSEALEQVALARREAFGVADAAAICELDEVARNAAT